MAVAHFQMLVIFSTHNFHFLETFSTCFVSASVARCRHVPPSELRFNLDEMTSVFFLSKFACNFITLAAILS